MEVESNIVDDQDTDQGSVQQMLQSFIDKGFDGDEARAALVLGRSVSEIRDMINGDIAIDDDMAMKVRGIADERGIKLL